MKRRVVVTGIGAVTPLGNSFAASWAALLEGRSGIAAPPHDFFSDKVKAIGMIDGFDPSEILNEKEVRRLDPFARYAVAAAHEAIRDAGIDNAGMQDAGIDSAGIDNAGIDDAGIDDAGIDNAGIDNAGIDNAGIDSAGIDNAGIDYARIQDAGIDDAAADFKNGRNGINVTKNLGGGAYVVIGSSRGGISTIERSIKDLHLKNKRVSPYVMPATTVVMAASYIAQKFGFSGGALGVSTACASGATAIGEAVRLVRHGYADMALAGGAEAPICRICIEGYFSAGALSSSAGQGALKPFDLRRDGFVLSEGACVLVLEEMESAKSRGARIYAEIAGCADTCDAFDQVRPDFMGEARAIASALKDAGIAARDVDFINAHGTSTPLGDIAESKALQEVFAGRIAGRALDIPLTANKSMTGHMLAASGAFEAAVSAMTIYKGVLPPTINCEEKDPLCGVRVSGLRLDGDFKVGVSNSFGFGGVNAVLVVRRVGRR